MAIKKYNPYTPSMRNMTTLSNKDLTSEKPVKSLLAKIKKTDGRNNSGKITVRRRGGGVKRRYRIVDFKRSKLDIPAKVEAVFYDPNRSANLALLAYVDGAKSHILCPAGLRPGDKVISGSSADIKVGNSKLLREMPVGTWCIMSKCHLGQEVSWPGQRVAMCR